MIRPTEVEAFLRREPRNRTGPIPHVHFAHCCDRRSRTWSKIIPELRDSTGE